MRRITYVSWNRDHLGNLYLSSDAKSRSISPENFKNILIFRGETEMWSLSNQINKALEISESLIIHYAGV